MLSDILLYVLVRQDRAGAYEQRNIRPSLSIDRIDDKLVPFISLAAEIIEPLAGRQVDVATSLPFAQDRRGEQLVTKHPFVGEVCHSAVAFWKIPKNRPHDSDAGFMRLMLVGIHIRNQAISQFDCGLGVGFSLFAEDPRLAMLVQASMYAHDGHKGREFHPARVIFRIGTPLEPAGVHTPVRLAESNR